MHLPDPDDPDFASEIRELTVYLIGGTALVFAVLCIGIAFLSQ